MCTRFFLDTALEILEEMFGLVSQAKLEPRYNIAPTQNISVVRVNRKAVAGNKAESGLKSFDSVRWGLIPHWTRDPAKTSTGMINARCETVAEKPSFRESFKLRRCLIPATGFYEWKSTGRGGKQPYCIRRSDNQPFAFAGLWDVWHGTDDLVIESCTMLTTEANSVVMPVHDRMPVIIDIEDFDFWLDRHVSTTDTAFQRLFMPYAANKLTAFPVSKRINKAGNDSIKCIEPVTVTDDDAEAWLFG